MEDDYENETPQYTFTNTDTDTTNNLGTDNKEEPIWPYFLIGGAIIIAFLGLYNSLKTNKTNQKSESKPKNSKTESLDRWKTNYRNRRRE